MNRIGRSLGIGAAVLGALGLFVGCGGGDDGDSRGGSFSSIQSAIESPTGTVDATTAPDVGVEFEKVAEVDVASGMRRDAQTAQASSSGSVDCPAGGSINVTGTGNESSGEASVSYASCCVTEGCCIDGNADVYYSTEQDAAYLSCGSYDLTYSCEGSTAALTYEGCLGSMGQVYVIEVAGLTYTVSGYYSDGSGSLEIRGANGTWTCTYSGDGGSCTGTGSSFDF